MIDRIELQGADQVQQVVGLGDENAPCASRTSRIPSTTASTSGHVREHIRCGHEIGGAILPRPRPVRFPSRRTSGGWGCLFSFASRALSVGSMPRTRQPPSLKFASSVPSFGADVGLRTTWRRCPPGLCIVRTGQRNCRGECAWFRWCRDIPGRKQDFRVHLTADLHQVRVRAVQQFKGVHRTCFGPSAQPIACRSPEERSPRKSTDSRFAELLI